MKPQQYPGEGSPGQDSKITFGEKLRQACEAALVSMAGPGSGSNQNRRRGLLIPKDIERRKGTHQVEDPIRTMMFLGSWSHT
ncbi:hypothetical protein TorRG33x02_075690 [Trema orientale]|uniref:Uncharacterized protein n=1 Tax=Trema orientale TaxID=63057 RepID=A0A2P5FFL1_TREOI|nr:hypothetical protein TorRG33x02_075690 [Trema orientale]